MALLPGSLLAQRQNLLRRRRLRQAVPPGQQAEPVPVAGAGVVVHPGVLPRRVPAQGLLNPAVGLQDFGQVGIGQAPQGGKDRPDSLGLTVLLQPGAQRRQTAHQLPLQGGDKVGQLQF